jgi:hypothetical protein
MARSKSELLLTAAFANTNCDAEKFMPPGNADFRLADWLPKGDAGETSRSSARCGEKDYLLVLLHSLRLQQLKRSMLGFFAYPRKKV